MAFLVSVSLGILTFALLMLYKKSRRPANCPPGPPTLPFIGNLNIDQKNLVKAFRAYRKEYGDVFSLIFGAKTVVVVNGTDAIREFLVKNADVTSERPDMFAFDISEKKGIISSSGHNWKEQRTFALNALREFGFGKRSIESKVAEEVDVVLEHVRDKKGEAFDIHDLLHVSISNITCSIVFGKRFDHNDETFLGLLRCFNENLSNPALVGVASFLPFVKYIPFDPFKLKNVMRNANKVIGYLEDLVREHKTTYEENDIRDFVDAYLKKMNSNSDENSVFTERQLTMAIGDLFIAGTETTTTTLRWFILFCIWFPDTPRKMRAEIRQLIGDSRLPKLEDRQNLPYCEAVLHETLRYANISPLGVPHGLTREMTFRGHTIPADAVIFPCLDSVNFDTEVFSNPEKFDPDRFLDENGKLTGLDRIIPFSTGRRVCLGESLARTELFLFTASLIQRFDFLSETDGVLPDLEGHLGSVYAPKRYRFRAVPIG